MANSAQAGAKTQVRGESLPGGAASTATANADASAASSGKKPNRNYPNHPLQKSLAVARAIQDKASGTNVDRLTLAELMENSPSSSTFVKLLQASRMYGLTSGGANAPTFGLTSRGSAATGGDEIAQLHAWREAVLSIEPYKRFLTHFNTRKVPAPSVCKDVLTKQCGVSAGRAIECMEFLLNDARLVGFIRKVQGSDWIDLQGTPIPVVNPALAQAKEDDGDEDEDSVAVEQAMPAEPPRLSVVRPGSDAPSPAPAQAKKVFIAHGKDHEPLEQVKKMLARFKVPHAVAVDEPHRGRPISEKVASLMREDCSSAIFIFTADKHFLEEDEQGNKIDVWRPSENVIYELGAASVLYDRRIVILKDSRINLASDFSDLGYISFDAGQIGMAIGDLIHELVALDIVEVVTKG